MAAVHPRLAIGASHSPTAYDGTGILSLCFGDPGLDVAGLVRVRYNFSPEPLFTVREVASTVSPRQLKRTGYGVRLRWQLTIEYETRAIGYVPAQEGTDNSLDSLASLIALTAAGNVGLGGPFPPYLYLNTTYQTEIEKWIPVDLDPRGSQGLETQWGMKTWTRMMSLSLVSQLSYQRYGVAYVPAKAVVEGPGLVDTLPAAVGSPPFTGSLHLTQPLAAGYEVTALPGHYLIVNFAEFQWFRFVITSIDASRQTIGYTAQEAWPFAIPTGSQARYRAFRPDPYLRMPGYVLTPFVGAGPVSGYKALPNFARLIGSNLV